MKKHIFLAYTLLFSCVFSFKSQAQKADYTWFESRFETDSVAVKKLIRYTCNCFQAIAPVNYDTGDLAQNNEIMKNALQCFFKELQKRKTEFGLSQVSDELIAYQKDEEFEIMGVKLRPLNTFFKVYAARDCPYIFTYFLTAEVNKDNSFKEMFAKSDSMMKAHKIKDELILAELDSTAKATKIIADELIKKFEMEQHKYHKTIAGKIKKIQGDLPAFLVIQKQDKTEEKIWLLHLPEEGAEIIKQINTHKGKDVLIQAHKQEIYNAQKQEMEEIWNLKTIIRIEK